jgi:hypothetical protein
MVNGMVYGGFLSLGSDAHQSNVGNVVFVHIDASLS